MSFVNSFLASSDASFVLPKGPYPDWLWPVVTNPPPTNPLTRTTTRERVSSASNSQPSSSSGNSNAQPNATHSGSRTNARGQQPPNPLQARRHPTMKITFPEPEQTPILLSPSKEIARENAQAPAQDENKAPSSLDAITSSLYNAPGISGAVRAIMGNPDLAPIGSRDASARSSAGVSRIHSPGTASPEKYMAREMTRSSSESSETISTAAISQEEAIEDDDEDAYDDDEEDVDEYEEDEEDDDDDDEDLQPTSQYISALDLAGFS